MLGRHSGYVAAGQPCALRRRVPENSRVEAITRDQRSVSAGVIAQLDARFRQRGQQIPDWFPGERRDRDAAHPVAGGGVV
jgi:hypothetical protein